MSGGHLADFKRTFTLKLAMSFTGFGLIVGGTYFFLTNYTTLDQLFIYVITAGSFIVCVFMFSLLMSKHLVKPTEYLAQAIFHISPNEHLVAAPNVDTLGFGKTLVSTLTRQIYDYASTSQAATAQQTNEVSNGLLDCVPVAIIGLDEAGNINLTNKTAKEALQLTASQGQPLNTQLKIKFPSDTLDDWISETKNRSIQATNSWKKVDISTLNEGYRSFFNISAVYQQKHPSGIETLLVMFDDQETFLEEEEAISLIALSVHEIRTPLTILRGYIEVLRQELAGKVDPATQQYIERMSTSSENLAAYMANILNVAKADQSQLNLQLQEANWGENLKNIVANLQPRAAVRGKTIQLAIAPDLPTVALDSVSINEVITNLVDNAIKYSPNEATNIWVETTLDKDGSILTTVRDEGVGIPESAIKNLFTRFYRNHRNRMQITGTGLGLYISKEIVNGHNGNIWVKSKEGQGTTVGFTLIPFSRLAETTAKTDNGFTKVSHGWIKNHTMQRR